LITPRSGEPLVAATQDFLTAAFLFTRRDSFFTRDEFFQAVATLSDASEHVDLPSPTILKPFPLWTGKQLFNLLLRPNRNIDLHINFETKARNYTSGEHLCCEDGYVVFRDGQLMIGNLCKGTLGGGSKKGLVYMLCRDEHPTIAALVLHRLTKMTSRWLMNRGFSIGIEDVAPARKLSLLKDETLKRGYAACDDAIAKFKRGTLALQPGCNEEQSLEVVLNGILSKLRDELGNICMRELPHTNPPRIMIESGSKGQVINVAQMVACVGQQSVGGSRIAEGFVDRTLPAFPSKAKEPAAKGFVVRAFP
jgi:DNA-directed RNA polymerase III subunit RPC1